MHSWAHEMTELELDNSIDERQSILPEFTKVDSFDFFFLFFLVQFHDIAAHRE